MSINARRASLQGFLLAGAIAGLAGGLHVLLLSGARKSTYEPIMSIEVFSNATIGGLGSLGAIVSSWACDRSPVSCPRAASSSSTVSASWWSCT